MTSPIPIVYVLKHRQCGHSMGAHAKRERIENLQLAVEATYGVTDWGVAVASDSDLLNLAMNRMCDTCRAPERKQ